jgi:hypothetical protein
MTELAPNPDQNAKTRKRVVTLLLTAVLLVFAALIGIGVVSVGVPLYRIAHEVRETRHRLLTQVDYVAVRNAARELIAEEEKKVHANNEKFSTLFSDDPRIPIAIRNTNPSCIYVHQEYVRIEYGGGFHHQGFLVVRDNEPLPETFSGDKLQMLIDGVWFYEDS